MPCNRLAFLSLAAVIAFLSVSSRGSVYFVDTETGSDSNSGTSQELAWSSVPGRVGIPGAGWVQLQHGDTILVKGGTKNNYQVLLNSTYYAGAGAYNSIQIKSGDAAGWGSGRAIFDQQNTRLYGFAFGPGSKGITLSRLEIREIASGANAIYGNGSACIELGNTTSVETYITVSDCYLHRAYGTMDDRGHGIEWYGPDATAASLVIIEKNVIENCRTKGIEVIGGTNNIIRQNFVQKTGDHGIVISSTKCDVYNNIIVMNGTDAGIAESSPWVHDPVFALKVTHSGCDAWNNIAFKATAGNGPSGFGSHGSTNRFFHNVFINGFCNNNYSDFGANAFNLGYESVGGVGNVLMNNIGALTTNTSPGAHEQFTVNSTAQNSEIAFNNFFSSQGTAVAEWHDGGSHTLYTMSEFDAASLANGIDGHDNQSANPAWVGGVLPTGMNASFRPNQSYFALSASSPEVIRSTGNDLTSLPFNGAQPSSKFGTDILGNTRTTWSMGAYEYPALPAIGVSPEHQDFGLMVIHRTADRVFTVRNDGYGTLCGTATVSAPFSIIAGASYSLGAGQVQAITVRFSPTDSELHTKDVTFTGGSGATATVTGRGTN